MNFAPQALALPTIATIPARGRIPRSLYRSDRLRHLRCAYCRLVDGRPIRWLARQFRVSARTVQLWVKAALGYSDPEAQALRDLLDRPA
jgi:hypothetical protein